MKSKLLTSLMLSGTVLSLASGTVKAASTNEQSASEKATVTSTSVSSSSHSNATEMVKERGEKEDKNDDIQTLKEQTMIIRKVVAKSGSLPSTVTSVEQTKTNTTSDGTPVDTKTTSESHANSTSNDNTASTSTGDSANTSTENNKSLGINKNDMKGVNNAKFEVYDVTDLMNTIIKEKLKTDTKASDQEIDQAIQDAEDQKGTSLTNETATSSVEASSDENRNKQTTDKDTKKKVPAYVSVNGKKVSDTSDSNKDSSSSNSASNVTKADSTSSTSSTKESDNNGSASDDLIKRVQDLRKNDTLRKELEQRTTKLNKEQMKSVAKVTTGHDQQLNADGVARTKLPIDGKYHAYYVVNTETPESEHATNSAPIVVITPVTDENGKYAPEFTIYPKSDTISEKGTPEQSTGEKQMFQTGSVSLWDRFINWFHGLINH